MLTLMNKDLRVVGGFGWLVVWLVAPSYLVPAMLAARMGGGIFWVNVAFGTAAIVSVCLIDARSGADRFIHSLPVTRTDVVRARYGTAVVLALLVLGVGVAIGLVAGSVSNSAGAPSPRWFSADVGLAYLVVMATVIAIYLPCYFRWGYGAGTVVAAILLAGLVIVGDVVGSHPGFTGAPAPGAAGLPRGVVVRAVVEMVQDRGLIVAAALAIAGAATMLAMSATVAARAYRTRQF